VAREGQFKLKLNSSSRLLEHGFSNKINKFSIELQAVSRFCFYAEQHMPCGIDFGETTVRIAAWNAPRRAAAVASKLDCVAGRAEMLANLDGEHATPSVVSFLDDGSHLVGTAAASKQTKNAGRTVTSFHSLLALLGPADAARDAAVAACAALPFDVVAKAADGGSGDRDVVEVTLGEHTYDVVDVLARLFGRVKADAEAAMGAEADCVAIAVPHDFSPAQRAGAFSAAHSLSLHLTPRASLSFLPPRAVLLTAAPSPSLFLYHFLRVCSYVEGGDLDDARRLQVRDRLQCADCDGNALRAG